MNKKETTTVLICGVGGQGTILAADILAKTALRSGLKVKLSEIHGMSQRGGSVNTIVRFGEEVYSPVCDFGYADHILSFEATEALRYSRYLSDEGCLFVNEEVIKPLPVQTNMESMPKDTKSFLSGIGANLIDAKSLALKAGSPKSVNIVLLGALSKKLAFAEEHWAKTIQKRVPPKTLEANLKAFSLGQNAILPQTK